ncbi:hypothetical protein HUU59_08950 [bacterium]|nr:hypothetical protein [bacterium]
MPVAYTGTHYTYVVGTGNCAGAGHFEDRYGHWSAPVAIYSNFGEQSDCGSATLVLNEGYAFVSHCYVVPAGGTVKVVAYDKTSSYFQQALCGQVQEQ